MPSPNAEGRRASATKAAKAPASAPGYDGIVALGGIVDLGENDSSLVGSERWKTVANMYRRPPVAIWARLRSALFNGVKWTATENEAGGKDAARGKEVVDQGLLQARLGTGAAMKPWSAIAARAINGAAAVGFSLHATAMARRKDGLVVYTDIASRPAPTIYQWFRKVENDETTPFTTVEQRTLTGRTIRIPLDEMLYVVNDNGTNSDSPIGAGMLFLIAERVRRLGIYEPLEGTELASSMGGIPITRAPIEEMKATLRGKLGDGDAALAKIALAITEKLSGLRNFVARRFKDPSKLAWFELDSATYQGSDPNTISAINKWGIEIVKGETQALPEMRKIIEALDLDIARMLNVEHVFIGAGTPGTFGAHESKLSALGASVNAEVGSFAFVATQQVARRIVAANGLDPDTACPTLTPSPVMRADIAGAVDAIVKIKMAGLPPNHPATKAVFEAVDMPWEDESESLLLPRAPQFGGFGAGPGGGKDPAKDDAATDPVVDPQKDDSVPTAKTVRARLLAGDLAAGVVIKGPRP